MKLRVFVFPGNPTFNPYWRLLSNAVRKISPETDIREDSVWFFKFREILSAPRDSIIHIHWLHEFYSKSRGIKRLRSRMAASANYAIFAARFLIMTYLKFFKRTKVIWTVHNADAFHIQPILTKFFSSWADALADGYIFHCRTSETHFLAGKKRKPSFVIPHGHFIDQYGPMHEDRRVARELLGLPENAAVFLILGIIRESKNIRFLLDRLGRMPHKNIRIIVAGHPTLNSDWASLMRHVQRPDERFIFLSHFIPNHQIRWLLAAADYLLNAQIRGYVSGATVTALSYGLPVVCLDWGCASSLITHGKNGFLFTENNFYPVIDRAIATRYKTNTYIQMRQAAYRRAERLSWDDIARQTITAYRTILR